MKKPPFLYFTLLFQLLHTNFDSFNHSYRNQSFQKNLDSFYLLLHFGEDLVFRCSQQLASPSHSTETVNPYNTTTCDTNTDSIQFMRTEPFFY